MSKGRQAGKAYSHSFGSKFWLAFSEAGSSERINPGRLWLQVMRRFAVTILYREPLVERHRRQGTRLYTSCFAVTANTEHLAVRTALSVFCRIEMLSLPRRNRAIEAVAVVEECERRRRLPAPLN